MIHELDIQNFGCIHDATIRLTRFHAFAGPNGSGKTMMLNAFMSVIALARLGSEVGAISLMPHVGPPFIRLVAKTDHGMVRARTIERAEETVWEVEKEDVSFAPFHHMLFTSDLLQIDYVRSVSKCDYFVVDNPEHGLYPGVIPHMMRGLRALSERRQVLIATHSPLIMNEMKPEEVTLVRRDSKTSPSVFTPITQTPNFTERSKVYALGELWVSYLDKIYEEVY